MPDAPWWTLILVAVSGFIGGMMAMGACIGFVGDYLVDGISLNIWDEVERRDEMQAAFRDLRPPPADDGPCPNCGATAGCAQPCHRNDPA